MLDAVPHDARPLQPLLPLLDLVVQVPPPETWRATRRSRGASSASAPASALTPAPAAAPASASAERSAREGLDAAELQAARRVYLGLATRWELTGHEALALLGEPLASEAERRERLCALAGVTRLLQLIRPEPEQYGAFLREPHPAFDGATPLQLMLAEGCAGIVRVRTHLVETARR